MSNIRNISLLITCLLQFAIAQSQLRVDLVPVKWYEQQLSGYRISYPIAQQTVRDAWKQRLSAKGAKPLEIGDRMVFEQISYAPISTVQPLTFLFTFEQIEGVLTRQTLVVMYNHQTPITPKAQPDLSLRLLLELASVSRELSGRSLEYDHLFEGMTRSRVWNLYRDRRDATLSQQMVQRLPERIGMEAGDILLNGNPFDTTTSPSFVEEDKVAQLVADRFRAYVVPEVNSPFLQEETVIARDSLHTALGLLSFTKSQLYAQQQRSDSLQRALVSRNYVREVVKQETLPGEIPRFNGASASQVKEDYFATWIHLPEADSLQPFVPGIGYLCPVQKEEALKRIVLYFQKRQMIPVSIEPLRYLGLEWAVLGGNDFELWIKMGTSSKKNCLIQVAARSASGEWKQFSKAPNASEAVARLLNQAVNGGN
ncbi:MAG: hypothetical protein AAGI38_01225 [Bacteroidota bacterium]